MSTPLLLLDAPSLYFRAFFGVPPRHAPDGMLVNALSGFLDMLSTLVGSRRPDRIVVCMDYDWRPAWRVALVPSYKTHRVAGDAPSSSGGAPPGQAEPPELGPQVPVIVEAMEAIGIPVVGLDGYEADDVIATMAARERPPVEIVTGDRDLFQLVRDPDVCVMYTKRGVRDLERADEAWVTKTYGIPGRAYADFAILRGDTSDGLPGVRGVGDRTAAALIAKYGSVEALLAESAPAGAAAKVAASREYVEAATKVVRLPTDLEIPPFDCTLPSAPRDPEAVASLGRRYGVAGPLKRLVDALAR